MISPDLRSKLASTDDADAASFTEQADALLDLIAPILAGSDAELQGAVIADLAAIWLARHPIENDRMREELLQMHLQHVRELVELYLDGVDG